MESSNQNRKWTSVPTCNHRDCTHACSLRFNMLRKRTCSYHWAWDSPRRRPLNWDLRWSFRKSFCVSDESDARAQTYYRGYFAKTKYGNSRCDLSWQEVSWGDSVVYLPNSSPHHCSSLAWHYLSFWRIVRRRCLNEPECYESDSWCSEALGSYFLIRKSIVTECSEGLEGKRRKRKACVSGSSC